MTTPPNRLMRSRTDKMIAGIAGGVGRYLAVDPVLVRLVFVGLVFTGIGVLIYPILWVIMPLEPEDPFNPAQPSSSYNPTGSVSSVSNDPGQGHEIPIQNVPSSENADEAQMRRSRLLGIVLVGFGAFLIFSKTLPWLAPFIIPGLLIGAGVLLLRRAV